MIVAVAGASGLLGRALAQRLRDAGRTVLPLPNVLGRLTGVDAVVNPRPSMTRTLVDRMLDLPRRPRVFLRASSLAVYGRRPGEVLDEAARWRAREEQARVVEGAGIRVVLLRLGRVSRTEQAIDPRPWIGLDDALRLLLFALERDDVRGPLNGVRSPLAVAPGFRFLWEAI